MIRASLFAAIVLVAMFVRAADDPTPVLFRDVTVIPMTESTELTHRDVLVKDGRIVKVAATSTVEVSPETLVVDGHGKYLLPGLAEMHAHLPAPAQGDFAYDMMLLFLAHGVTTVRGTVGDPWHLELRARSDKREILAPRLFVAAPPLRSSNTTDAAKVTAMIRGYARDHYDLLKLHPSIGSDGFDFIVSAARQSGISFQGHVPDAVGLSRALDARMYAIDHIDGYVRALAGDRCADAGPEAGFFGVNYADCADPRRIGELVARTKAAGTWMVPTVTHLESWVQVASWDSLRGRPAMRYLPAAIIAQWHEQHASVAAGAPKEERAARFLDLIHRLIREMNAQGVPIALGSDTPQAFNIPGDSTLNELERYADIGLEPYQALRTATANPARFFNSADRFGTVREGLEADLILIDADPLADIRAVRKLSGVMARGRWMSREEIRSRLDALPSGAAKRSSGDSQ